MWRSSRSEPGNDQGNAEKRMEVAAARGVGAGREDFPDRAGSGHFLWKRSGQPATEAVAGEEACVGDRGESGVEGLVDSVAIAAADAEGIDDSRARAGRDRAAVCGRRSDGGTADRLVLG